MAYTLGIDIGTYESKGVLVDGQGRIGGQAARPHEMIVPRPGWAEHRADEDWWDDLTFISRSILDETGIDPKEIEAVAVSAIGPCMLPVDSGGRPLMNAVLYGVDGRAHLEIEELTQRIGEDVLLDMTRARAEDGTIEDDLGVGIGDPFGDEFVEYRAGGPEGLIEFSDSAAAASGVEVSDFGSDTTLEVTFDLPCA